MHSLIFSIKSFSSSDNSMSTNLSVVERFILITNLKIKINTNDNKLATGEKNAKIRDIIELIRLFS